jgi:anaerobic ribonucleoside-triphosphate reductase activating protein
MSKILFQGSFVRALELPRLGYDGILKLLWEKCMNYAQIKNNDIANGPGIRVSLFVSGCTHRCPGCFNEVAWDFDYGQPFTQDTIEMILTMISPDRIRGLTLLGGEPFEPQNQGPVLELLREIKKKYPQKSIWAFSGYLFDRDILAGRLGDWQVTKEYLSYLDVLVDGPFIQSQKNLSLRFRGSENQRLIDVPASLQTGTVVLWKDWQEERK